MPRQNAAARSTATSLIHLLCFALTYVLVLCLCAPFIVHRVVAAPPTSSQEKAPGTATAAKKKKGKREQELLVRFRRGIAELDKTRVAAAIGGRRVKKLKGSSHIEQIELPAGSVPEAFIAQLRLSQAIDLVEPNYLVSHDEIVPDDERFAEQWALKNIGQTGGQPGADISAAAWEQTTGAVTTVVAVIDSGVDFTHPDLANNRWVNSAEPEDGQDNDGNGLVDDRHGWDWVRASNQIRDEQGHGTALAGIIAAEGDNHTGISGVMWRASLMSLRVLDNTGTGDVADAVKPLTMPWPTARR